MKNWLIGAIVAILFATLEAANAGAQELTLYDTAGAHPIGSDVQSVDVAFGPFGQVLEVVGTNGSLIQFDSGGGHLLFGTGVQSVDTAFGPSGQVLAVISIVSVPEPTSLAFLGAGLTGFCLVRRRSKAQRPFPGGSRVAQRNEISVLERSLLCIH